MWSRSVYFYFKNKGKDKLGIPKSGRGRLQELLIPEVTIQTGFPNTGRNKSWSLTREIATESFDCSYHSLSSEYQVYSRHQSLLCPASGT